MRAQLIPLDGSGTINIDRDVTLVGRQEGCDMRIQHKSVSKMHCVIARTDGLLLVRDLGSTNGTRVNGQRVRRAALLPNDNLAVAGFKFRVHLGPDDEAALPEDRTQQLDAQDVSRLLHHAEPAAKEAEQEPEGPPSVQANALPDVYPADKNDPLD
ncbi:MAG TPA: FHA domain-containing protein [Gemmataceae bacterium]|nr:FHA domain-containing protein [Gemmataceae bacterium]